MGIDKILLALALTGLASLANAANSPVVNAKPAPTPTTTTTTTQQTTHVDLPKTSTVVSPEDIKRFKAGSNDSKAEVK
ncbi:hypothetical protein [Pseudomonas sp. NPDC089734]|uniref:hypothetical protein n=1 Tax=Pseudomonas sp. NPDC089734 TaxID=3364469 RepID=UPI0038065B0A